MRGKWEYYFTREDERQNKSDIDMDGKKKKNKNRKRKTENGKLGVRWMWSCETCDTTRGIERGNNMEKNELENMTPRHRHTMQTKMTKSTRAVECKKLYILYDNLL